MRRAALVLLLAFAASLLAGCSGDLSAGDVKAMDKKREETAKNMPGNDIPKDPADGR